MTPAAVSTVLRALRSRRTRAVALLSFSSGLPLGLVWYAIPDWMRSAGVDIRIVGLSTLAHAPWAFKMLWSPLMDRYSPPWGGRRRGWIAASQIALFALTLCLAGVGHHPQTPWVILALALAIAFASASQDIVIDAYAVEVLRVEEHGIAVGARTALYRAAMWIAGSLAITLAARISWPAVNGVLAAVYLPLLAVTRAAPEPEHPVAPPRSLREAVWLPFLGFLGRHRALEILAFVLLYKLADNLAQSLQRPFLFDMGYDDLDRGIGLGGVGLVGILVGTFAGGALTTAIGLGHCLWIFGILQIVSNVGYLLIAQSEVNRWLMYGALSFETLASGLGMGAFGVLLLRLTQKRFSATQYALFSSLFALPRMLAGPITGAAVHAVGWTPFFWFTLLCGIPGLLMLARFVPPGTVEPEFTIEPPRQSAPLSTAALALRAVVAGIAAASFAVLVLALLGALEAVGAEGATRFDLLQTLREIVTPSSIGAALELLGALIFGGVAGLFTAAVLAARSGGGRGHR